MRGPEARAQLVAQGVKPVYEGSTQSTERRAREVEQFSALAKRANISMD